MNASDVAKATSAMDSAVAFIKAVVPAGTAGKVDVYCDLQFASMRLKSELGYLDIEIAPEHQQTGEQS